MENSNGQQSKSDELARMKIFIVKYRDRRFLYAGLTKQEREEKILRENDIKRYKANRDHDTFDRLIRQQEEEMGRIFQDWRQYDRAEQLVGYAIEQHSKAVRLLRLANRLGKMRETLRVERERLAERKKMIPSILRDFTELPFCEPFEIHLEEERHRLAKRFRSCSM